MTARAYVTIGCVAAAGLAGSAVGLAHRGGDAVFLQEQRHPPRLQATDVSAVVVSAPDPRTGKGRGVSADCSPGSSSLYGNPWSCKVTYRDGHRVRLRVRVHPDGTYSGRYAGGGGATGCCIDLPGAR